MNSNERRTGRDEWKPRGRAAYGGGRVPRGRAAFGEKPPKFQPQYSEAELKAKLASIQADLDKVGKALDELDDPRPIAPERLNKWAVEVFWIERRAWEERHGITGSYPQEEDGGGDWDPNETPSATESPKIEPKHPFFSATHIQPHPLKGTWLEGPKTLRDGSGITDHLRNDAIFGRQQIISDKSGRDVGRIEQDTLYGDRQVIKDRDGKRVGSIETNWQGERVIKDKDGKETGKFKKKWWGDTEIK